MFRNTEKNKYVKKRQIRKAQESLKLRPNRRPTSIPGELGYKVQFDDFGFPVHPTKIKRTFS